jgi:hypothetical protein
MPVPAAVAAPAAAAPPVQTSSNPPSIPASFAAKPAAAPLAAVAAADQAAASTPPRLAGVSVEIVNGNGINGAAARLRLRLQEQGVKVGRLANLRPYNSPHTQVLYRPGKAEAARAVVNRMPVDAHIAPAPAGSTRADLSVLIGLDVRHSAGCAVLAACAPPVRVASLANGQGVDTASDGKVRR